MAKVIWTARGRQDFVRLREFLAIHSPEAAGRALSTIRTSLNILKTQPESGAAVAWLPQGYREWYIPFGSSGYVILYRYLGEEIVIQALRHGRESGYQTK